MIAVAAAGGSGNGRIATAPPFDIFPTSYYYVIVNGIDNGKVVPPALREIQATSLSATMAKKRVTIKQVAKDAGVSTQTVSRVINRRPDVAPETRLRVQQIIDRLGYQPSHLARSLIQGHTYTLGVVGTGLEYFGPSHTLSGIEKQAQEMGYKLLLTLMRRPEQSDVEPLLRDMLSRHVEGIIWAVPEIGNNRAWTKREIPQLSVPLVLLSMQPRFNLSVVAVDNRNGGRMATRHLLAQGYRTVGLISGPLEWWEARQRRLGWQDALTEAGKAAEDDLLVEGDWTAGSGERGLRRLLARRPDVDAVFVCNDQMAAGALQAARQMGRRVPDDLAMVGFDDIPESAYLCPPLSTVRQDLTSLGRCAVRELGRRIASGHAQQGQAEVEPKTILLQPQLVVRESSSPPG